MAEKRAARHVFVFTLVVGAAYGLSLAEMAVPDHSPQATPSCVAADSPPLTVGVAPSLPRVSLVRLISDPERYDGKRVETQAFFVWAHEDQALYLSPDEPFSNVTYNGLVVDGHLRFGDPKKDMITALGNAHLHYVTAEGTFHAMGSGHLGSHFAGRLSDVVIWTIHTKVGKIAVIRMKRRPSR